MKIALLAGNRFNPWHLPVFDALPGSPEVVAFRADSEIQQYFNDRDDGSLKFAFERIYFDTQAGNPMRRAYNVLTARYRDRETRVLPFHERLKDFDLLQSWELFTDWTAEAVRAKEAFGMPLSLMIWDNIPFNQERDAERVAFKRRALQSADRFIVHTERSRRMLEIEGVNPERIVQMLPGIDTDAFSPGPSDRARFGLAEDEFVILFVGWFLPRKGLDFLVLALHELIHDSTLKDRRIRLLAVGSGPGKDRVDALIDRLGIRDRITFAGSVRYHDMPNAFRAADVFVLPSIATPEWQEQFGMSLIEAMACGVPVVTTYSGAIPEITGDAALLCQPNDFVSLYDALKKLIKDPNERVSRSQRGRARALESFRLDQYARALGDVYATLLGS